MMKNSQVLKGDFDWQGYTMTNLINLNDEESEKVRVWRNDKNVSRWLKTNHEISRQEHEGFIQKLKLSLTNFAWLVSYNKEALGVISLTEIDEKNREAYLGIYVIPQMQLKGVGVRLIECLKYLAFSVIQLETLKLETFSTNEKAQTLFKKTGFKITEIKNTDMVREGFAIQLIEMEMKAKDKV